MNSGTSLHNRNFNYELQARGAVEAKTVLYSPAVCHLPNCPVLPLVPLLFQLGSRDSGTRLELGIGARRACTVQYFFLSQQLLDVRLQSILFYIECTFLRSISPQQVDVFDGIILIAMTILQMLKVT